MISLKQINNQYVKAIPIPDEDTRLIKGYDICEEFMRIYFYVLAKRVVKLAPYSR